MAETARTSPIGQTTEAVQYLHIYEAIAGDSQAGTGTGRAEEIAAAPSDG